ncbi:uncharacterized protein A1O9_04803 [Exophiala aquamarina CBS 119918]|uniref:Uncharacterized protein n=1 Tax=Exophiala aquamarina CBS 119918 TaxID=1182545 RepID=A0A072PWJ0_9EURO|nr:uncharacterized protein A1O9_04803 [Exophiala aquamarina CBS 119918]KEF59955.1 hypothetical protein A1O9_04803 [Exophiala aquamarina CBS 119918]
MVTTRSQEKGLSTPVSASKVQVIVPTTTQSTPRPTDSPSTTRKTRSSPRQSDSTKRPVSTMGTSASKAKSNSDVDGFLVQERNEDSEHAVSDSAQELAQRSPTLLPERPTTHSRADMLEASNAFNDIVAPGPPVDPTEKESLNLPERLKFSPPRSTAVPLNTHKRFRSEEPANQVAFNNEHDKGPFSSTIEPVTTTSASDESDDTPEVVSIVLKKSTDRLAHGHKRRRLEEGSSGGLHSPKIDRPADTSPSEKETFLKETLRDTAGEPSTLEQSKESGGQKLVDGDDLDPIVLESSPNASELIPTKMDGKDITFQGDFAPVDDAGSNPLPGDVIPSLSGKDATLDPVIAQTGFKVPYFAKHEAKIAELSAESVDRLNTSALDDAESGSHTEAGSATLTNNSFVTVPENQPMKSHGETCSDAKDQTTLTETASFPSTVQESSPKHMAVRQARPSKAVPQAVQKATSLQDFRKRLLDRNPRTNVWGPPGFRKTRFVGA